MTTRSSALALAVLAGLTLSVAPAWAHVTVNPREAEKGGFTKLAFRVPNERDDSGTSRLEVTFPADHPIAFVSVKPHPGWSATIEKTKLATPVTSDEGDTVSEAVSKITWSGGVIKPGEFDEFEVSAGPLPDNADVLVFKTVQTYQDGQIVRWIDETPAGGKEPEHPAPELKLVAAGEEEGGHPAPKTTEETSAPAAEKEKGTVDGAASRKDVDSANRLAVGALVAGLAGVVLAIAAFYRRRPHVS